MGCDWSGGAEAAEDPKMGEWGMNLGHTNHQRSTGVIVTKQHNGLVSQKNTRKPNPPPLCPNTGI